MGPSQRGAAAARLTTGALGEGGVVAWGNVFASAAARSADAANLCQVVPRVRLHGTGVLHRRACAACSAAVGPPRTLLACEAGDGGAVEVADVRAAVHQRRPRRRGRRRGLAKNSSGARVIGAAAAAAAAGRTRRGSLAWVHGAYLVLHRIKVVVRTAAATHVGQTTEGVADLCVNGGPTIVVAVPRDSDGADLTHREVRTRTSRRRPRVRAACDGGRVGAVRHATDGSGGLHGSQRLTGATAARGAAGGVQGRHVTVCAAGAAVQVGRPLRVVGQVCLKDYVGEQAEFLLEIVSIGGGGSCCGKGGGLRGRRAGHTWVTAWGGDDGWGSGAAAITAAVGGLPVKVDFPAQDGRHLVDETRTLVPVLGESGGLAHAGHGRHQLRRALEQHTRTIETVAAAAARRGAGVVAHGGCCSRYVVTAGSTARKRWRGPGGGMGVSAGKLCVARRGILLQDNIELVELFLLGKNFFRQRLRLLLLRRLWGPRRGSLPGCVRAKGVVAVATWMRAGVSCVDVEVDRRGRMGGIAAVKRCLDTVHPFALPSSSFVWMCARSFAAVVYSLCSSVEVYLHETSGNNVK